MARGISITAAAQQEIVDMFVEGKMSPSDISRETGYAVQSIYRILNARNIRETETNDAAHLEPETVCDIIDDYVANRSVAEIIAEYRISPNTMYSIIREAGVPTRAERDAGKREQRINEALEMYKAGEKVWAIQQATGISTYTLNLQLHKRKIPLRRERRDVFD